MVAHTSHLTQFLAAIDILTVIISVTSVHEYVSRVEREPTISGLSTEIKEKVSGMQSELTTELQ